MGKENYFQSCGCKSIIATRNLSLNFAILLAGNSYSQKALTFKPCRVMGAIGSAQLQTKNSHSTSNLMRSVTVYKQNREQFVLPAPGIWITETRITGHYNPSGGGSPGAD
ncbi:hypothetical protein [Aurantibacillus circumpalustris]|uniref:hypothetical protein n=1 Tax=Aurantibacillus circumpalustris TaxID=3036359 RepID=UPI00295C358E|nr:hypothetical protein [Aurantibacillus circumpalustris]